MAWWPFGKKRRKDKDSRKSLSSKTPETLEQEKPLSPSAPPTLPPLPSSQANPFDDPQEISEKLPQLPQLPQTPQQDSQPRTIFQRQTSVDNLTALPQSPRKRLDRDTPLQPVSASYLNAQQEPTLVRRQSSRRRKDDSIREEQIRSMTAPMPIPKRSGAESPRLIGNDRKRRSGPSGQYHDPSSTASLAGAGSARSSIAGMSDLNRFDIGPVDAFSPRPTLRHSIHGQYASAAALRASQPSRSDSRKEMRSFSPATIDEKDTIDDFADGMDSRTLRELMERDERRTKRRKKAEAVRAQRRLERHASGTEGQDEEKRRRARRKETGASSARDVPEAGPSGIVKEYGSQGGPETRPQDTIRTVDDPFEDPDNTIVEAATVEATPESKEYRRNEASSPPRSPPASPPESPSLQHYRQSSNLSNMTEPLSPSTQDFSDAASYERRASQPASSKRTGALAALFKRTGLGKRSSTAEMAPRASQGSFSNTSRESMPQRSTPPPSEIPIYRRRSSGAPLRTKSKFTEELADTPSIEAGGSPVEEVPPLPTEQVGEEALPSPQPERKSYELDEPSATLLSQSLASVDSEASWLSGRPQKRTSQQLSIKRSSLTQKPPITAESAEETDPAGESSIRTRDRPSLSLSALRAQLAPDKEEEEDEQGEEQQIRSTGKQVGQGFVSRRPVFVESQRTKSSEGLVRQEEVTPEEENARSLAPVSTPSGSSDEQEPASEVQIRQTFPLQHARSISAGSARLLDIPARRDSVRLTDPATPTSNRSETPKPTSNL